MHSPHYHQLLIRHAAAGADEEAPACETGNDYNGYMGQRISSIFVILLLSTFGAVFPILARRRPQWGISKRIFFFVKYFGSGVIVATAFIHLLTPASEALNNPCLTGVIKEYPWTEAIAMMAIFVLFFVELLALSFATFSSWTANGDGKSEGMAAAAKDDGAPLPGQDHLSHAREHQDIETAGANHDHSQHDHHHHHHHHHHHSHQQPSSNSNGNGTVSHGHSHDSDASSFSCDAEDRENYAAQLTSIFILEFGVIFHSFFIGLTLAVSGEEFKTLYVVLVFHQFFEGLGLGSRLAVVPFPDHKRWTPYILAVAYGVSTPIAIAIGLGIRKSYPPEGRTTLIVNGVFDSISAGILLYTGLVELMAHEFLFSAALRRGKKRRLFAAYAWMVLGATLMALLGKWA